MHALRRRALRQLLSLSLGGRERAQTAAAPLAGEGALLQRLCDSQAACSSAAPQPGAPGPSEPRLSGAATPFPSQPSSSGLGVAAHQAVSRAQRRAASHAAAARRQPAAPAEAGNAAAQEAGTVPVRRRRKQRKQDHSLTHRIHQAQSCAEVLRLCEENAAHLNVYHSTAAIHRLGRLIGIRRSESVPVLLHDRQADWSQRQQLLESAAFARLQEVTAKQRRSASPEMLCLVLWGLARLRRDPNLPPTPQAAVDIAQELERRLDLHAPFAGSPVMLSQACWALSQMMRQDAPWGGLLCKVGLALQASHSAIDPGPASAVLKAAATYQVVFDECPLPPSVLDFLAASLLQPDLRTPSPQAISQGLYSLAKLGHVPSGGLLQTLCLVLPTRVTGTTVDRQAVGNSMWAMAQLGFVPGPMLYRQLLQLVLLHCSHFLPHHFSQVFVALLRWDRAPEPAVMQGICKGLIQSLPVLPDPRNRVQWDPISEQLAQLAQHYAEGEVPLLPRSLALTRQVVQETAPLSDEELAGSLGAWAGTPEGPQADGGRSSAEGAAEGEAEASEGEGTECESGEYVDLRFEYRQ